MISVAMASYNGEKYIAKQLKSICNQTVKVDEIIIVDDCSKDNTVEEIKKIMKEYPESRINLVENESNLGYKKNFHRAISMCRGDILFLCDQDDVWVENKVEIMKKIMDDNQDIDLLSSSFMRIDGQGNTDGENRSVFRKKLKKNELIAVPLKELVFHNISQGCSMAMRKNVVKVYLEHFSEKLPHDWMLNVIAAMQKKCYYLNRALFYYRIHDNNTIGLNEGLTIKEKNTFLVRAHDAQQTMFVTEFIRQIDDLCMGEEKMITKVGKFAEAHVRNLKEKRFTKLFFQNFNLCYWKLKTVRGRLLDIVYCFNNGDLLEEEEK